MRFDSDGERAGSAKGERREASRGEIDGCAGSHGDAVILAVLTRQDVARHTLAVREEMGEREADGKRIRPTLDLGTYTNLPISCLRSNLDCHTFTSCIEFVMF